VDKDKYRLMCAVTILVFIIMIAALAIVFDAGTPQPSANAEIDDVTRTVDDIEIAPDAATEMFNIHYSEDKKVAIILLPHDIDTAGEVVKAANTIELVLSQGYVWRGNFHTDTGLAAAHFRTCLVFVKPTAV